MAQAIQGVEGRQGDEAALRKKQRSLLGVLLLFFSSFFFFVLLFFLSFVLSKGLFPLCLPLFSSPHHLLLPPLRLLRRETTVSRFPSPICFRTYSEWLF